MPEKLFNSESTENTMRDETSSLNLDLIKDNILFERWRH